MLTKLVQLRGDGWRSYLNVKRAGLCEAVAAFVDPTSLTRVCDAVLAAAEMDINCTCLIY